MRAHRMPGAISMTWPVGGGSGAGNIRELLSVLVSIVAFDLPLAGCRLYPGTEYFALHLKRRAGEMATARGRCAGLAGGLRAVRAERRTKGRMSERTIVPSSARSWGPRPPAPAPAAARPARARAVRVALKAAGINFPDVLMIQGLYQHRPELPFVPGLEAAGVVTEVAADVVGIAAGKGDRAHAHRRLRRGSRRAGEPDHAIAGRFLVRGGRHVLVAHMTAYHGLKTRARIAPGQTLLVLGAAGGVGLAAVQMGKVLGARVLAAASSPREAGGRRRAMAPTG